MRGMLIRGSELQEFLRCRKRWQWSYIENLERKRPDKKLFFGTLLHKYLELWYKSGDAYTGEAATAVRKMWDEADMSGMEQVEIDELWDLLDKVVCNYVKQYREDFNTYEVLATEFTFAVPVVNGFVYTGTIDLVLKEKATGRVWFTDHKTTSSIEKYDKNSEMDRQISRYWWALQQLSKGKGYILTEEVWVPIKKSVIWEKIKGIEPHGFFYNIVLRDYPVPPRVLKSGKLSTDKSQKTTYEMYIQALKAKGFEVHEDWSVNAVPDEYAEIVYHLANNPREFFRRTQVIRNQTEIDMAMAEALATFKDMKTLRRPTANPEKFYRNITTDCSWDCQFFDLCKASLDGSNVDFLKESLFTKKVT